MPEFPVFPVGTMDKTTQVWLLLHAQSSNIIPCKAVLSNKATWHHATPQDVTPPLISYKHHTGGLNYSSFIILDTLNWKKCTQNRFI